MNLSDQNSRTFRLFVASKCLECLSIREHKLIVNNYLQPKLKDLINGLTEIYPYIENGNYNLYCRTREEKLYPIKNYNSMLTAFRIMDTSRNSHLYMIMDDIGEWMESRPELLEDPDKIKLILEFPNSSEKKTEEEDLLDAINEEFPHLERNEFSLYCRYRGSELFQITDYMSMITALRIMEAHNSPLLYLIRKDIGQWVNAHPELMKNPSDIKLILDSCPDEKLFTEIHRGRTEHQVFPLESELQEGQSKGGKKGQGSRRQSKRQSTKRGSTRRKSAKRGSTRRQSSKRGSTRRQSAKRGSTRRQSKKK